MQFRHPFLKDMLNIFLESRRECKCVEKVLLSHISVPSLP